MGCWRAFGMAAFARCCPGPFRPPNQSLLSAKASCPTHPPLLLAGSKVPNGSGSADQVATRWAWILLAFRCFGCVLTGLPINQSFLPHPSTFAFRGFEGAKLQRLCRPSGYRATLNLAGVSLFRMRAHRPAKAFCPNCSGSADQVATPWAWILLGFSCFGCVLTGDAGGCDVPLEWLLRHGAAQRRYVRPTNACCLPKLPVTRPPLLLAGSKVPNSSGSADQVATQWAWILLGFPCFGCVLTGDAGGCDVPLE